MRSKLKLLLVGIFYLPYHVDSTSFKMDFLSSGTVRTDPLMFSQIGNCLSDHVHRFYGATSPRTMRPDVTYEDLRSAPGNTGNVEENKSLYWNPAIYQIKNPNGEKTFELVDIWFASAYYVFRTKKATAFPSGLKMKAFGDNKLSRVTAVCDGSYPCERNDAWGCNAYGPSNQGTNGFLPVTGCSELELNIKFPTCWDGKRVDSTDGSHVAYSSRCDGERHNECFDFDCPSSHPIKMPELHLYVRVRDYEGGAHMFADGSDVFHSDYFSGWDEEELQRVLDNCDNDSEAANPNAFCSDWLTFRGKPKEEGVQVDDDQIESDLKRIQPSPIDIKRMISPERVTSVSEVPRGTCSGTLIPDNSVTSRPSTTTIAAPSCYDNWNERKCARLKNRSMCERNNVQINCRKTCESCGNNDSECKDEIPLTCNFPAQLNSCPLILKFGRENGYSLEDVCDAPWEMIDEEVDDISCTSNTSGTFKDTCKVTCNSPCK